MARTYDVRTGARTYDVRTGSVSHADKLRFSCARTCDVRTGPHLRCADGQGEQHQLQAFTAIRTPFFFCHVRGASNAKGECKAWRFLAM